MDLRHLQTGLIIISIMRYAMPLSLSLVYQLVYAFVHTIPCHPIKYRSTYHIIENNVMSLYIISWNLHTLRVSIVSGLSHPYSLWYHTTTPSNHCPFSRQACRDSFTQDTCLRFHFEKHPWKSTLQTGSSWWNMTSFNLERMGASFLIYYISPIIPHFQLVQSLVYMWSDHQSDSSLVRKGFLAR